MVVSEIAPGSRAARAGLEPGDVITAVNWHPVTTIREIDRVLDDATGAIALSVWRDGRARLVVLRS